MNNEDSKAEKKAPAMVEHKKRAHNRNDNKNDEGGGRQNVCRACCACLKSWWPWPIGPQPIELRDIKLTELQKERLITLRKSVRTPYSDTNLAHRKFLHSFGKSLFGEEFGDDSTAENALKSRKWATIGFQGLDPSTDFRAAGFFGLENLVYFAATRRQAFDLMCSLSQRHNPEYMLPCAISGMNMTWRLAQMLSLHADPEHLLSPQQAALFQSFMELLGEEPMAFQEVYCEALLMMEDIWSIEDKQYMDFPLVLDRVLRKVSEALARKPVNLREFHEFMCEEDALPVEVIDDTVEENNWRVENNCGGGERKSLLSLQG
eukprot:gb/GEZN01010372.1/.p1 GENE.gb/GEZN01010372.1/~~gb/GEZN01010372.1/.p1  ORF type:complete len:319 (-),score=54.81 gb/GEZN01010372.1/:244-1200(-)